MNETWRWLIWLAGAYLSGATPFGLLLGWARGVDVRARGSGNVGATNTGRVLGRKWGVLCFVLDLAKGLAPVLAYGLAGGLEHAGGGGSAAALRWMVVGAAAVLGHVFPIWLRFKGGKGVATSVGVLLGMWPVLTVPAVLVGVVWLTITRITGYVSLASIVGAAVLPVLALLSTLYQGMSAGQIGVYVGVTAALAALVVWRHRGNIGRLARGVEPKAGWARRG